MTSDQINNRLQELDLEPNLPFELFNTGKAVPYVGWLWRQVDFDAFEHGYRVGIFPDCKEGDEFCPGFIGFMQNNKWDYSYIEALPDDCKEIRRLMEIALEVNEKKDFVLLNNKIQGLKI